MGLRTGVGGIVSNEIRTLGLPAPSLVAIRTVPPRLLGYSDGKSMHLQRELRSPTLRILVSLFKLQRQILRS
jgi:hypothetical protein